MILTESMSCPATSSKAFSFDQSPLWIHFLKFLLQLRISQLHFAKDCSTFFYSLHHWLFHLNLHQFIFSFSIRFQALFDLSPLEASLRPNHHNPIHGTNFYLLKKLKPCKTLKKQSTWDWSIFLSQKKKQTVKEENRGRRKITIMKDKSPMKMYHKIDLRAPNRWGWSGDPQYYKLKTKLGSR